MAARDAGGNTVAVSAASVTLGITSSAGAVLTCAANPVAAVAGVARFAGCSINKSGTYTLTATSGKVASAVSTNFTITTGPATMLAFSTNASGSASGSAFAAQPVVAVQDAGGNTVTSSTASVTLSITTPAGAIIACAANPKTSVSGVATFAGCRIDKAGTYTLTASSSGLTTAVGSSLTIPVGAPTKLAFIANASGAASSVAFATQPVLVVQDAGGNTVTSSAVSVTLSITTPAGAALTCSANPVTAVSGVATFAGCRIDKAGTYTLTATSGGLTSAVSSSFTIAVGAAAKLAFTASPSNSVASTAIVTQPVVVVQDVGGNTVTSTASVNLSITTPAGAILTCTTNSVSAVSGVATFAGCRIDKAGTYTLTASSSGLTSALSSSFTISTGPATKLAFTTSPSNSVASSAFTAQPVMVVQDAGGNTVSSSIASVALSITTPAGAILTCTANPKSAVSGLVTFAGCRIDKAGTYTLTASSSGLTTAVSSSFTITAGVASRLAFTANPSSAAKGIAFGTQPLVVVQDASGNTVASSTASVTLSITGSPGGTTLTCTSNPRSAVSGVATFAGCRIDKAGTYTLTATSSGLTNALSTSFTISG